MLIRLPEPKPKPSGYAGGLSLPSLHTCNLTASALYRTLLPSPSTAMGAPCRTHSLICLSPTPKASLISARLRKIIGA